MILDDETANVRSLERLLASAGLTDVASSTDPRRGVTLFRDHDPDLLLLDVNMPGLDGFQVLEALSPLIAPHDYRPILVLTADGDATAKRRALSSGAKDFLTKPFGVDELMLRVGNLLQTRLLHVQLGQRNRTLETLLDRRTSELEEARFETLERLARAAEFRDDETGQHTRRVASLSATLTRALGLGEELAELVRRTAPLHDIGKIGIPDSILLKPGRLTPEERAVMCTHTTIGARILASGQSALMRTAEEIAHAHHEWWNGAGYPRGIAGAAIPLTARIVAVADFADALSSDRPYRPAYARPDVIAEIDRGCGVQFDPDVVDALRGIEWWSVLARAGAE